MWVSKAEWKRLQERLSELETHMRDSQHFRYITVYKKQETPYSLHYGFYTIPASQQISVTNVIEKICDHLGIELVYEDGKPASVALKKVAKKAA